ncbi:MAG: sugar isomerase domain-containing protein [Chthonomonadales bacterium]|nr:sugar isomerase domain-containing protein [Chthonomonadales bacterium]
MQLAYLSAVRRVLDHLESTQAEAIERAADLAAHALTHGGAVFCAEIGHANQQDFLNRAGGLAALQPFSFAFSLTDPVADSLQDRPRQDPIDREMETVRLAVRTSSLRAGDVLLVGSVSGRNVRPVELALACRGAGVHVVGFTSLAYTRRVESRHPSGKRLFEVVDVVIDNGAPYGDAAVTLPGIEANVLPVSGVAMTVAGWLVWETVMRKMAAAGDPPTTFVSVNREGGPERYRQSREAYNERGY